VDYPAGVAAVSKCGEQLVAAEFKIHLKVAILRAAAQRLAFLISASRQMLRKVSKTQSLKGEAHKISHDQAFYLNPSTTQRSDHRETRNRCLKALSS
jgi:hypothetical protein